MFHYLFKIKMKKNIFIAIRLTLVCLVFFCGFYTMTIWAISRMIPGQGQGITIIQNGNKNYENVGQNFSSDKYFWSRPSAVNYNAAGSGGSNKGTSNPQYLAEIQTRIDSFLAHNPEVKKSEIPSDLITASGSGIDPHISVQAALVQVARISKSRNISKTELYTLIENNKEYPLLGLFGTERINVLKLNLALNKLR